MAGRVANPTTEGQIQTISYNTFGHKRSGIISINMNNGNIMDILLSIIALIYINT